MKIDKIPYLAAALGQVGIRLDKRTLTRVVDLVNLIEDKGDEASIRDIAKLEVKWEQNKL